MYRHATLHRSRHVRPRLIYDQDDFPRTPQSPAYEYDEHRSVRLLGVGCVPEHPGVADSGTPVHVDVSGRHYHPGVLPFAGVVEVFVRRPTLVGPDYFHLFPLPNSIRPPPRSCDSVGSCSPRYIRNPPPIG
jgi:hypothetical protein